MPRRTTLALLSIAALATTSPALPDVTPRVKLVHRASARLRSAATRLADRIEQRIDNPELGDGAPPGGWPEPSALELAAFEREIGSRPALSEPEPDEGDSVAALSELAPSRIDPDRVLAATAKETFVYERPSWGSRKLGYLRAGAVVARSAEPAGHASCADGWYAVAPSGYVCVGKMATLDLEHPVAVLMRTRPDRNAALPYAYGLSRPTPPPFYTKLPTLGEQRSVEPELGGLHAARDGWEGILADPAPTLLAPGRTLPTYGGRPRIDAALSSAPPVAGISTGRAVVKSGFAFVNFFESEGRRFGLSADLDLMPLDKLAKVEPSAFHGVELGGELTLPIAFSLHRRAPLYSGTAPPSPDTPASKTLGFREAVGLSGRRVNRAGVVFLETKAGEWLRADQAVIVPPLDAAPGFAVPGRTWIDVSILRQSLVAYEGTRAVYATLVSTGADGLGDPKTTHSTVLGDFLIHTKHVTTTMSGDEVDDEFDLRDVPYVQYFTEGYALHAAYWHDAFGRPHSHGCINLSPLDAKWLFRWTDPPVPNGWHGAMSLRDGTLVHIHP